MSKVMNLVEAIEHYLSGYLECYTSIIPQKNNYEDYFEDYIIACRDITIEPVEYGMPSLKMDLIVGIAYKYGEINGKLFIELYNSLDFSLLPHTIKEEFDNLNFCFDSNSMQCEFKCDFNIRDDSHNFYSTKYIIHLIETALRGCKETYSEMEREYKRIDKYWSEKINKYNIGE